MPGRGSDADGVRELEAMRQVIEALQAQPDRETRLRVLAIAALQVRQYGVAAALLGELVRLPR